MKLSRLYSNKPDLFEPIDFVSGLNVVLAEIRLPENRNKDTHNLGKTTLGRLLDFCFLSRQNPKFFLFKYPDFWGFIFFLEIELDDASFITISRSVDSVSKISFKKHEASHQDFTTMPESKWDHIDIPYTQARIMLDSLLDWRALQPWNYRKQLGYQLRSQADFGDVFQLNKFKGVHSGWKPYLAHILGFNDQLIDLHYKKEDQLKHQLGAAQTIKNELGGGSVVDISKIEGILLLKRQDVEKKQKLLDAFNFRAQDKERTKELVDNINEKIAALNAERYSLTQSKKKIAASLEDDQILFNPEEAQRLFDEAGVLFQGQIKQDYQKLIAFNRAITEERRGYLQEEHSEIETELKRINAELNDLSKQSSDILAFLKDTDVFNKYKQVSNEMVILRADITSLERQRGFLHRLQELRTEIRTLTDECSNLQSQIETDVEHQNAEITSLFSSIRLFFSEIVESVIARKALLSVSPNKEGHLEFKAEILDESGNATDADEGYTYRKLLCIAFDLALLRAHLNEKFPRFVYHDGVFESLDNRKKDNLLAVIRQYADLGIQPIITLIDSDLPVRSDQGSPVFDPGEIILTLHDENEQGRLFKMKAW